MAVSYKDNNSRDKKRRFAGGGVGGGGGFKKVLRVLVAIVAAIFVSLCLFGVINQRATGESIIDWASRNGQEIGKVLIHVFKGDDESPVDATDQGLYLKGHAPEDSNKIVDEKNANKMENELKENVK